MEENENVEETTNVVEETQFESAEDPSVIKVDLSKPPTQNETPEQETTDSAADNTGVVLKQINLKLNKTLLKRLKKSQLQVKLYLKVCKI